METVFRALADPTRRALLDALFERDGQTLVALTARHDMTRVAVAKHLRTARGRRSRGEQAPGAGEVALPQPGADPPPPRPLGQQVHRAVGGRPDRPESRTGDARWRRSSRSTSARPPNGCGKRSPTRRSEPSTTSARGSSPTGHRARRYALNHPGADGPLVEGENLVVEPPRRLVQTMTRHVGRGRRA